MIGCQYFHMGLPQKCAPLTCVKFGGAGGAGFGQGTQESINLLSHLH